MNPKTFIRADTPKLCIGTRTSKGLSPGARFHLTMLSAVGGDTHIPEERSLDRRKAPSGRNDMLGVRIGNRSSTLRDAHLGADQVVQRDADAVDVVPEHRCTHRAGRSPACYPGRCSVLPIKTWNRLASWPICPKYWARKARVSGPAEQDVAPVVDVERGEVPAADGRRHADPVPGAVGRPDPSVDRVVVHQGERRRDEEDVFQADDPADRIGRSRRR